MDGDQPTEQPMKDPQEDRVFFDQPISSPRLGGGNKGPVVALLVILLLLAAVGGWFFFIRNKVTAEPTPTPFVQPTSPEFSSPTPSSIDKSSIRIEILNGTGIAGEAGFLKDKLKDLGYSSITVGNATDQEHTKTEVAFAVDVPGDVKDEVETMLKDVYKDVTVTGLTQNQLEIRIVTGLRKGATPKPSAASSTPKPSATAQPSATPTPTPTATQ